MTWLESKAWLGVSLIVAVLFYFDTTLCPTAGLFGIPCPSCGLTRAAVALLRGEPKVAYAMHPGIFLVGPYLLFAVRYRDGKTHPSLAKVGFLLIVLLLVLWAARFFGTFGGPVPVKRWG